MNEPRIDLREKVALLGETVQVTGQMSNGAVSRI